ncbi:MAG: hypothetical protein M3063_04980 [Actinomycetota bacterium]|nr:hypothetical protein [Actinomycetota bacterium]
MGLAPAAETILSAPDVETVRAAFCGWLGVGSRGVIVFPFTSLQPVPRPRRATADGRRRLPRSITAEGARHPLWWFDAHTMWQDPDEDDLAYGVRLVLELEGRGLVIPDEGPVDALATGLGWELGDSVTDARVAAYAAGGWDPDLCRFELPPGPVARGELRRRAAAFLAPRLAMLESLEAHCATTDQAARCAESIHVDRLGATLGGLVDDVRRCGRQLHHQASEDIRGADHRSQLLAARQDLASSLESLAGALDDLDNLTWPRQAPPKHQVDSDQRRHEIAAMIGAIYATPASDPPYRALERRLEAWRVDASLTVARRRRVLDEHSGSSPDRPTRVPKPTLDARHRLGTIASVVPFPD